MVMSSKGSDNKNNVLNTPKNTKVTIDVPADQYKILTKLKEKTGKSLKAIVAEGVPLIILKHADMFERKNVLKELDEIEDTLTALKDSKE